MENPSSRQAQPGFDESEQGELFECHLTAIFPSPDSQAGIALAVLLKGEHLRQTGWLNIGWRLAAAIQVLKDLGWPVISFPVRVVGRKRPIADYSLPQWVLAAIAGTQGAK